MQNNWGFASVSLLVIFLIEYLQSKTPNNLRAMQSGTSKERENESIMS